MGLSKNEFKILIGTIFIRAYKNNDTRKKKDTLNSLANVISSDKSLDKEISAKTLKNYYQRLFIDDKTINPNENTIYFLLNCLDIHSVKEFKENYPLELSTVIANLPKFKNSKKKEEEKDVESISNEKNKDNTMTTNSSIKNHNYSFFAFCVVAIIIVAFFFAHISKTPNIKIVNDLRQIHPTKETQFFSPTTNEPLVFYANYNQKIEFFNANGVHPKTKQPLKPVTQEFIKTHFVGKLPVLTKEEQQQNEVLFKKTNYNNKPLSKQNNSLKSTDKKTKDVPKTTVIIKDNAQTDYELSSLFKKNYTKTKKPYTCTGKVAYTFKESDNGHFVCELGLSYIITNNTTKKTIDEGFIKSKGSGLSKSSARNNALEKIQFD